MKRSLLIAALAVLSATACQKVENNAKPEPAKPIALTTRHAEKVAADNAFAFNLFRQTLATADDPTNAFISPLSVTMALGMLYNGTSAEAGAEMAAALGVADFSAEEINEYYRTMSRALLAADSRTALAIANSIWSDREYPVKPTFFETNSTYYDAEARSLDFSAPSTLDAINDWCSDNTAGKIEKIIEQIPTNAVMYLINATYFKGQWKYRFDKSKTHDGNFHLSDGTTKSVKMMSQQDVMLPYYQDEQLTAIELPYGNGAFGMVLMMPTQYSEQTLDGMIAGLDAQAYDRITDGLQDMGLMVAIPRFKQECTFSLNDAAKALGIERIFAPGNLGGIADDPDLAVSDIAHKTFVEVNEEGTEAAAVTSVEFIETSIPAGFSADRPFLYLIRERSTGAILFLGRMDNPS